MLLKYIFFIVFDMARLTTMQSKYGTSMKGRLASKPFAGRNASTIMEYCISDLVPGLVQRPAEKR